MKAIFALVCTIAGLLLTATFAAADDGDISVEAALGVYRGDLIATNGLEPHAYVFEIAVREIDLSTGRVVVTVNSDFYQGKTVTRNRCVLDTRKSGLAFSCKDRSFVENYEIVGATIKADASADSGIQYKIAATRLPH
jgi:hypothetical protein